MEAIEQLNAIIRKLECWQQREDLPDSVQSRVNAAKSELIEVEDEIRDILDPKCAHCGRRVLSSHDEPCVPWGMSKDEMAKVIRRAQESA
jgi:hypothetical protein